MQEGCWGALISRARCRCSDVALPITSSPFLANFCAGCQMHGICVPTERVVVPRVEAAALFLRTSSSNGPWSTQPGLPRFRVANEVARAVGPGVVIFESPVAGQAANANVTSGEGSLPGARWEPLPGHWLYQPPAGLPCVRFVPMHETLVLAPSMSEACAATVLPLELVSQAAAAESQAAAASATQVALPQSAAALWRQRRPHVLELVSKLMAQGVAYHVPFTATTADHTLILSGLVEQLDAMIQNNPLAMQGRPRPHTPRPLSRPLPRPLQRRLPSRTFGFLHAATSLPAPSQTPRCGDARHHSGAEAILRCPFTAPSSPAAAARPPARPHLYSLHLCCPHHC